jgi:hypothetical protein
MIKFLEKKIQVYIEKEIIKRKEEITLKFNIAIGDLEKSLNYSKSEYEKKEREFLVLKENTELKIKELERVRNAAEEEQKRLWERLDILRDNLNTEDVWIKLWECAYSKAVDAVWPILQKELLHMVELAEQRVYLKAKDEFDIDLKRRIDNLISTANMKEAVPFVKISALIKRVEEVKLNAERVKNIPQIEKCSAQLEILGGLLQ